MLRFNELHQFATGEGQTVAVIDTGVNRHDFLGDRLARRRRLRQRGGNGLDDCDGHGTEVAGIIAADPKDEAIGFQGIAPDGEDPQHPPVQRRTTSSGRRTATRTTPGRTRAA